MVAEAATASAAIRTGSAARMWVEWMRTDAFELWPFHFPSSWRPPPLREASTRLTTLSPSGAHHFQELTA
jgi:hypothetical protein